jgi:hypothetical protein
MESTKLFVISSTFILLSFFIIAQFYHIPFAPNDAPPARVVESAKSLWNKGSLEADEFLAIYENFHQQSKTTNLTYWQDAFSLGANNKLYPKHSIFSVLVGSIFYGFFGNLGFIIFHLLALIILFTSTYVISLELNKNTSVYIVLLLILFGTQILFGLHTVIYDYDIHATSLIMLSIAVRNSYPTIGGLLISSALLVRPSFGLLLPIIFILDYDTINVITFFKRTSGVILGMIVFMLINSLTWGGPLTTAFDRCVHINAGGLIPAHHPKGFNAQVFIANWPEKLIGTKNGFLLWNSSLLLLPLSYGTKKLSYLLPTLLVTFLYSMFIFSYESWNISFLGNRFLLPVVFLLLPISNSVIHASLQKIILAIVARNNILKNE